ncbi:sulfotransferase family 2 domain-containing protein [Rhabdothermincola sp.]|uniref:sulfotransferase family 2 domain-containing protein n=1 Tax=Rhabdothermincola sp. TaxID=2820405 RepID=UPI002FE355D3
MTTASATARKLARRIDPRPRYNYTVSRAHGFVYYRVAKVATRSISAWLRELDPEPVYLTGRPAPFDPLHRLFRFGFVRNPWDRLVSCWLDKVIGPTDYWRDTPLKGLPFDAFVHQIATWDLDTCDRHVRRQAALLPPKGLDFIGRFEHLDADVARVADRLGLPASGLPRRNTSSDRQSYHAYYTPELADLVGRLYAVDASRFGYTFDGIATEGGETDSTRGA